MKYKVEVCKQETALTLYIALEDLISWRDHPDLSRNSWVAEMGGNRINRSISNGKSQDLRDKVVDGVIKAAKGLSK